MLFFNTFGVLNTFGVFQTYYESGALFTATSSNISWIGSSQSFLLLLTCFFSGPIFDRGMLRLLLAVGSFMVVFGFMMLSLCHEYYQALLAQGFCVGIGSGLLFLPSVAILPTYFSTKLGAVVGIAASGSSLGGVVYPIVFYRLLPRVGFGWSIRTLGFIELATLVIPNVVMRLRVKPPKVRELIDLSAFKNRDYVIFVFGSLLGFAGLYVGLFYLSFFGQSTRYTDGSLSFYLVPILNAASIFGRILPNMLSDKLGPFNVLVPGAFIVSIVSFCLLAVHSKAGLLVETLFFGFASGIFVALPPVVFHALITDKHKFGTWLGMGNAFTGLGILIGGPGGGKILQRGSGLHWTDTWAFAGTMSMACALLFLLLRILRSGFRLEKC
ncbi:major facilitator superfamily domain-containing protein [Delphinella strobiligena]|nr:major facilitator superfamily domain-containing protein [Delphinella strobiligena]